MSREYDLYLEEHKANVAKGYHWIKENIPALVDGKIDDDWLFVFGHDSSKDDPEEYDAYDAYFYGGNRSFEVVRNVRYAWLHHIHNNCHHWQYYVLINDNPDEGMIILDMPYNYVLEMVCDWWAFSWQKEELDGIFDWYEQHKNYMKLSNSTRVAVEWILGEVEEKLKELA